MNVQYADQIWQEYKAQSSNLLNTYCQLRNSHPFTHFDEVGKAIWRANLLTEIWEELSVLLNGVDDNIYNSFSEEHFEGDTYED